MYCFEDEKDMLAAWSKYLVACDADIITGYNIQNFDIDCIEGTFNYKIAQIDYVDN